MKSRVKKEKNITFTHKSTPNIQKIEQEKRRKRREYIREKVGVLQQGRILNRVTEQEGNLLELGHDRQEEGNDEEVTNG